MTASTARRRSGSSASSGTPERNPGVADLALRPDQPLGHGGLGHEEGPGDLRRREPSEQPERERHLGAGAERRVAAGEDQAQPVVAHRDLPVRFVRFVVARLQQCRLCVAALACRFAAEAVDRPVARRGDDPAVARGLGGTPVDGHRSDATVNARPGPPPRRRRCHRTSEPGRPPPDRTPRERHARSPTQSQARHAGISVRVRPGTDAPRPGACTPGWPCGPTRAPSRDRAP